MARSWIGTPYHHQASLKGVGCDCLGLVRGVFAEITGHATDAPPAYTPDWAEAHGAETLIEAAHRHLKYIGIDKAVAGDVIIFRYRAGLPAKHIGILTSPETMVHAYTGRAVVEVALGTWWLRRRAAAFRFPRGT